MNLTYNDNTANCVLHNEMKSYEATSKLKADERQSLLEWVAGGNSVDRNPFYVYSEDGKLMDYISAFRHCVKEHKISLRNELKVYEPTITNLTDKERFDLREWISGGNSVYDNPYHMTDDYGYPMDFIDAIRAAADLRDQFMRKSESF